MFDLCGFCRDAVVSKVVSDTFSIVSCTKYPVLVSYPFQFFSLQKSVYRLVFVTAGFLDINLSCSFLISYGSDGFDHFPICNFWVTSPLVVKCSALFNTKRQ